MDVETLYRRTVASWTERVNAVAADQWDRPTPCTEWSVRALVNHVVGEDRWTGPLMGGRTIEEVGSTLDGDLLGDDPVAAAGSAAQEAMDVVARRLPSGEKVHLSYGDEDMREYLLQLGADHLVHGWDLAAATGGDTRLDPDLVSEVSAWFAEREEMYRGGGVVGPRASLSGDPQTDLLAAFGRDASWGPNHATLAQFSAAWGTGDVDAMMSLVTDDCVFESTSPTPDGARHVGAEAVRTVWTQLFEQTRDPQFDEEEWFVCGDRAVLRWRFSWTNPDGTPGHVRGVDALRLRDGRVAEKLSYVKG